MSECWSCNEDANNYCERCEHNYCDGCSCDCQAAASLPESQPSPEEPPVESMSADDLIDWIAYHANKQDRDWEYLRKELLRRVSQPSPSGDAQAFIDAYENRFRKNRKRAMQWADIAEMFADWLRSHDAKVGLAEQRLKKSLLDMLHNHGCESGPCNACKSARAALQEKPQ